MIGHTSIGLYLKIHVFENTDFSRSLFLSIEGKKYLHFEDLFNYNKELCEKAYYKLSNIKTLLQIESNLK